MRPNWWRSSVSVIARKYAHAYVCVHMYAYICDICVRICMHTYAHIYRICMRVYYVCILYVQYAYICVCVHMYARICLYVCIHMRVRYECTHVNVGKFLQVACSYFSEVRSCQRCRTAKGLVDLFRLSAGPNGRGCCSVFYICHYFSSSVLFL